MLPILDDTRNIIGDTSTLASVVGNFIEVYAMLWLRVTLGKGLSLILGRGLLVVKVGHVNVKGFCFPLTVGVKNLLSILDDAGDIVSDAGTLTNTMSNVVNIHTVFWLRIASDFVFFVENWQVVDGMESQTWDTPDRIASNFPIVDDWTMTLREPVDFLRSQLQIRTGGRMSFALLADNRDGHGLGSENSHHDGRGGRETHDDEMRNASEEWKERRGKQEKDEGNWMQNRLRVDCRDCAGCEM